MMTFEDRPNGRHRNGRNGKAPPAPRTLPHNLDLEASILGGVLLRPGIIGELGDLESEDFYHFPHKAIWRSIRELQSRGRPIDVVTLESQIELDGKLDAIGGIAFLGELAHRVPTADNVLAYRDAVRELSRERRAILFLADALERASRGTFDPGELIAETIGQLSRFEDQAKAPPKRLRILDIEAAFADLQRLRDAPVFETPFPALNDALGFGGFLGTQVYTVAAGTGRGKTTWVSHVAAHVARTAPVLVVSYEMRPGYFIARKAAGVIGRHSNDLLRGNVPMEQVLAAMPYPRMYLMHRPSLAELREAVTYVARKHDQPPLVVVDYIQKLADEIALAQARPDLRIATSQASATLCDIAEKTGAAVIAVSAIGRGKGKILANPRKLAPYELVEVAKESGAVEYDGAGMIVLSLSDDFDGDERIATMTAAKCRFGEECHIEARYDGRMGTWRSLERAQTMPRLTVTPDDGSVRDAILAVLAKGPQRSKSSIHRLCGKNKTAVLSELDVMVADSSIEIIGGAYCLPGWVSEQDSQRSF